MRTLIISVIICLNNLPVNCIAQSNAISAGWKESNLKGKVQCYVETHFLGSDHFGEIKKTETSGAPELLRYCFDEQGNPTVFSYRQEAFTDKQRIYKYDEQGNHIETSIYDVEFLGWLTIGERRLTSKYIYNYDNQGNRIEETKYGADGGILEKIVNKYDNQGNKTHENRYNKYGTFSRGQTYKYDEQGNEIERISINSDGSISCKWIYKYDEQGNEIEMITDKQFCGTDSKSVYIYDEQGNRVQWISTSESTIKTLDGIAPYHSENIWLYQYEYDEQGNWIRRIERKEYRGTPYLEIYEREYEYYD